MTQFSTINIQSHPFFLPFLSSHIQLISRFSQLFLQNSTNLSSSPLTLSPCSLPSELPQLPDEFPLSNLSNPISTQPVRFLNSQLNLVLSYLQSPTAFPSPWDNPKSYSDVPGLQTSLTSFPLYILALRPQPRPGPSASQLHHLLPKTEALLFLWMNALPPGKWWGGRGWELLLFGSQLSCHLLRELLPDHQSDFPSSQSYHCFVSYLTCNNISVYVLNAVTFL